MATSSFFRCAAGRGFAVIAGMQGSSNSTWYSLLILFHGINYGYCLSQAWDYRTTQILVPLTHLSALFYGVWALLHHKKMP
jgi:hypothetical protein